MLNVIRAMVCYFAFYLVACVTYGLSAGVLSDSALLVAFLAKPSLLLVASIGLLVQHEPSRESGGSPWPWFSVVLLAGILLLNGNVTLGLVNVVWHSIFPLLILVATLLASWIPVRFLQRLPWLRLVVPCVLGFVVMTVVDLSVVKPDRLGLVAFPPNSNFTLAEWFHGSHKDNYPAVTLQHNSLGFRDVEPVESVDRHGVLVVGDSFVWGDGIPTNDETLGALLRTRLDEMIPDRFDVMSAACPGNGLWGYLRFVEVLAPIYGSRTVIVGIVGPSDLLRYDAQFLMEALPPFGPLRRLFTNARVVQHFHESVMPQFSSIETRTFAEDALRELAAHAATHGYRAILMVYGVPLEIEIPAGIEVLSLPDEQRYEGVSSPLWYAKDHHPKPALNALVAAQFAGVIVRGSSHGAH